VQLHIGLPLPRKRSSDGASTDWDGVHLVASYYSFIYPEGWKAELAWLADLERTFYRHNGHPSAAGGAQDKESSPVKDQRSTTVVRNQRVPQFPDANVSCEIIENYLGHVKHTDDDDDDDKLAWWGLIWRVLQLVYNKIIISILMDKVTIT